MVICKNLNIYMAKRFIIFIVTAIISLYFLNITGCGGDLLAPNGSGVIRGRIVDSLTATGIKNAAITTIPQTTYTVSDGEGNYYISGITDGSYQVIAKAPGYYTKTGNIIVFRDTSVINMAMLFTNVYIFDLRILSQYFNLNSLCAMNMYTGTVMSVFTSLYDIKLSMDSTRTNYCVVSGNLAGDYSGGFETKFSDALPNPFTGGYVFSKAEFDTLNKYYAGHDELLPSDFPNDRTPYFSNDNKSFNVFAFWLKGRNFSPPTYGMIFLQDSYNMADTLKLVVDVKINRNGLNLFYGNQ